MAVAGGSIMAKEQEELRISSSAMGLAEVRLFGSSERPILPADSDSEAPKAVLFISVGHCDALKVG